MRVQGTAISPTSAASLRAETETKLNCIVLYFLRFSNDNFRKFLILSLGQTRRGKRNLTITRLPPYGGKPAAEGRLMSGLKCRLMVPSSASLRSAPSPRRGEGFFKFLFLRAKPDSTPESVGAHYDAPLPICLRCQTTVFRMAGAVRKYHGRLWDKLFAIRL